MMYDCSVLFVIQRSIATKDLNTATGCIHVDAFRFFLPTVV